MKQNIASLRVVHCGSVFRVPGGHVDSDITGWAELQKFTFNFWILVFYSENKIKMVVVVVVVEEEEQQEEEGEMKIE